jgi:high-affinity Fe2+/Pb2+ permease
LGDLACTWPRAATILGAIVATFMIYLVSTFAGRVDLAANGQDIGPLHVIGMTLIAGLIAWGLLAFLERRTSRAWTMWRNIALVALVISMLGPLGADDPTARIVLSVMHAVAGAIIIRGFRLTARKP